MERKSPQVAPIEKCWDVAVFPPDVLTFAGGPSMGSNLAATSSDFHKKVVDASEEDLADSSPYQLYVVGGIDCTFKPVSSAWRFDSAEGAWEELPPIASPRAAPVLVLVQKHLYMLGGEVAGEAASDAHRFDPCLGQWEQVASMLEARIRGSAVAAGGYVYVCGGLDGLLPLRSAERYDPRTNAWEALPPMHQPRYACTSSVTPEGDIIVFGGELTDQACPASIERFDPKLGSWELLPGVRAPLCGAAVAVSSSGEAVFTVGGVGLSGQALAVAEKLPLGPALSSVQSLAGSHFVPPAWTSMPPMKTPRHLASMVGFGSGVVVVGGKGPTFEAINNVEVFDPTDNTWESLSPLPSPRLRAAVVGGRL